jgi:hypothetical protein
MSNMESKRGWRRLTPIPAMSGFETMHLSAIDILMMCALYSSGMELQWGGERKVGVKNASYRRTPLQLVYITDLHPEVRT